MTSRMKTVLAVGVAALAVSPALADGFSFGFSWGDGPRYYRPYTSTYVYRDCAPIYYSNCAPVVVAPVPVCAPPVVYSYPRPIYRSYSYPRYYGRFHGHGYYGRGYYRGPHVAHYSRARWR